MSHDCKPPEPDARNDFLLAHARLLSDSLKHGCGLIDDEVDPVQAARQLYFAPFALLSHDTAADPRFNYANRTAQQLFAMEWDSFVGLPSRLSAEAPEQAERDALLRRVAEQGFIDDYRGIRIAADGRRFLIEQATVWNLRDDRGCYRGQAAMFAIWHML